jgi:hypothetical protein
MLTYDGFMDNPSIALFERNNIPVAIPELGEATINRRKNHRGGKISATEQ